MNKLSLSLMLLILLAHFHLTAQTLNKSCIKLNYAHTGLSSISKLNNGTLALASNDGAIFLYDSTGKFIDTVTNIFCEPKNIINDTNGDMFFAGPQIDGCMLDPMGVSFKNYIYKRNTAGDITTKSFDHFFFEFLNDSLDANSFTALGNNFICTSIKHLIMLNQNLDSVKGVNNYNLFNKACVLNNRLILFNNNIAGYYNSNLDSVTSVNHPAGQYVDRLGNQFVFQNNNTLTLTDTLFNEMHSFDFSNQLSVTAVNLYGNQIVVGGNKNGVYYVLQCDTGFNTQSKTTFTLPANIKIKGFAAYNNHALVYGQNTVYQKHLFVSPVFYGDSVSQFLPFENVSVTNIQADSIAYTLLNSPPYYNLYQVKFNLFVDVINNGLNTINDLMITASKSTDICFEDYGYKYFHNLNLLPGQQMSLFVGRLSFYNLQAPSNLQLLVGLEMPNYSFNDTSAVAKYLGYILLTSNNNNINNQFETVITKVDNTFLIKQSKLEYNLLEVYSLNGQLLYCKKIQTNEESFTLLNSGLYFAKLSGGNKLFTEKIVVE